MTSLQLDPHRDPQKKKNWPIVEFFLAFLRISTTCTGHRFIHVMMMMSQWGHPGCWFPVLQMCYRCALSIKTSEWALEWLGCCQWEFTLHIVNNVSEHPAECRSSADALYIICSELEKGPALRHPLNTPPCSLPEQESFQPKLRLINQICLCCLETAALIVFAPEMSKPQMSATTLRVLVDKPSLTDPVNIDDEPRACTRARVCVCVSVWVYVYT